MKNFINYLIIDLYSNNMNYYYFFFYLFYKCMLKVGRNDIPEIKAVLFYTMWLLFYLAFIIYIPHHLKLVNLNNPTLIALICYAILIITNFKIFIWDKEYVKIKKEYDNQKKISSKKSILLLILFLLLPFTQLIYVLLFKIMLK